MNASDRLPDHRSGNDGLYVNLDYRLKGAVEQQLKDGTWKPTFFNVSNGTPILGAIRNTLTNQKDKDARNNLQSQNDKAGREGDNAILFGRPTETVFFEQNSSEYKSDLTVDGNNVCNDDAVKASKLFIKANPDYSVAVVGSANTDNASGNYNNQQLSEDRANITLSQLTTGIDAVPGTKVINNGGVGPSAASVGRTPQGTKELNRNAKVNFIIPKQP
jgi:outer membrane protein OmpA-like peptidoglycan-associated protein